jgi:hypothetical protein
MKTIKTLLFGILITFSSQIFANTAEVVVKDNITLQEQVKKLLNSNETSVYQDIVVKVEFKLNEHNEITVMSVDSEDFEIIRFIKTSLNKKTLSIDTASTSKLYSIPVKFIAHKGKQS